MFEYKTSETCSKKIIFDVIDNKVSSLDFVSGCPGNLIGIKSLVIGMDVDEVIKKLEGITCGSKNTSCPDQLTKALTIWKNN